MSEEQEPAPTPEAPEVWGVVEVMGHVSWAGRLKEATRFGAPGVLIEIPVSDGDEEFFFPRFYGAPSIYGVVMLPEEAARRVAASKGNPVPWEARRAGETIRYRDLPELMAPPPDPPEFPEVGEECADDEAELPF